MERALGLVVTSSARELRNANAANHQQRREKQRGENGGDEGDRTLDLRIANATLSQLSYVPGERRSLRGSLIVLKSACSSRRAQVGMLKSARSPVHSADAHR